MTGKGHLELYFKEHDCGNATRLVWGELGALHLRAVRDCRLIASRIYNYDGVALFTDFQDRLSDWRRKPCLENKGFITTEKCTFYDLDGDSNADYTATWGTSAGWWPPPVPDPKPVSNCDSGPSKDGQGRSMRKENLSLHRQSVLKNDGARAAAESSSPTLQSLESTIPYLPRYQNTCSQPGCVPPDIPDSNCPTDGRPGAYFYENKDYKGACFFSTTDVPDFGRTTVGDNAGLLHPHHRRVEGQALSEDQLQRPDRGGQSRRARPRFALGRRQLLLR